MTPLDRPLESDRALLAGLRRGDRDALTRIYRQYFPLVHAFVCKGAPCTATRQAADIEEILQEVFVRAFQEGARQDYDGLRPYESYLFAIAANVVADRYRRKETQRVSLSASENGELPEPAVPCDEDTRDAPDTRLEDEQLARHAAAFVAGLSADERAVFVARFFQDASIEAAAHSLAVSEFHVKSTEKRLRKRFFSEMRRHGYFQGYQWRGPGLLRSVWHRRLSLLVCMLGVA